MSDALAQCRQVTRRFGSFTAVDRVDLRLDRGEVVGLLGANGAGKTTVIRMLLGLLATSDGEVELFGEPPSRRTRQRIGYVPQTLGLYDDLTPVENLEFSAAAFGIGRADSGRDAVALPESLRGYSRTVVGSLPLGAQRGTAFAQALAHHPDLLILDEPTSGLDPLGRMKVRHIIQRLKNEGKTVFFSSHELGEVETVCDRVAIINQGELLVEGSVADLSQRYQTNLEQIFLKVIGYKPESDQI